MQFVGFWVFYAIAKALAILPLRVLYVLSDLLYIIVFYVVKYRRNVVFDNLRHAFPEKSEVEIVQIAKKFYRHLCDVVIEILKLLHMPASEMRRRFVYKNPEVVEEAYNKKQHILVAIGHYNNWEWGVSLAMQSPHHFVSIYAPLTNPYFDQLMIRLRTQFGGEVVPMKKTIRVVTQYVKENKYSIFCFIADQSPYATEIQYWTDFLHRKAPVHLGLEKLARAAKQPVFFAKNKKIRRGYYEVEVIKVCEDASLLPEHVVTDMHVKILEDIIKEQPEYWLWTHRRWKHQMPNA